MKPEKDTLQEQLKRLKGKPLPEKIRKAVEEKEKLVKEDKPICK